MRTNRLTYPLPDEEIAKAIEFGPQVIAIGDFDGVHLGHKEVISTALSIAKEKGVPCSIMTFDPHPREVLGQAKYSKYLAPLNYKLELFQELGVDNVYIVHFDEAFALVTPEQFIDDMLSKLQPASVVVGFDFTFGHRGAGTVDTLRELGAPYFDARVVKPYHLDGEKVSSTLIRENLHLGRLDKVSKLLGRFYSVQGQVVKGDGRGRTIGFPTANIELNAPYVVPRSGVYAVKAVIIDHNGVESVVDGVANIGVKPTFGDELAQTIEAHLFDFNDDLYDKTVTLSFVEYIREERKFSGVEELIQQIRLDAEQARTILRSLV